MPMETKRTGITAISALPEGPEADFLTAMSLLGFLEPWNYPTVRAIWEAMKSQEKDSGTSDPNKGGEGRFGKLLPLPHTVSIVARQGQKLDIGILHQGIKDVSLVASSVEDHS